MSETPNGLPKTAAGEAGHPPLCGETVFSDLVLDRQEPPDETRMGPLCVHHHVRVPADGHELERFHSPQLDLHPEGIAVRIVGLDRANGGVHSLGRRQHGTGCKLSGLADPDQRRLLDDASVVGEGQAERGGVHIEVGPGRLAGGRGPGKVEFARDRESGGVDRHRVESSLAPLGAQRCLDLEGLRKHEKAALFVSVAAEVTERKGQNRTDHPLRTGPGSGDIGARLRPVGGPLLDESADQRQRNEQAYRDGDDGDDLEAELGHGGCSFGSGPVEKLTAGARALHEPRVRVL